MRLVFLSCVRASEPRFTFAALCLGGVSDETRLDLLPLGGVVDKRLDLLPFGGVDDNRLDLLPLGGVVDARLPLLPFGTDDSEDKLALLPCSLLGKLCFVPSKMNSFLDNGSEPDMLPLWLVPLDLVSSSLYRTCLLNSTVDIVLISFRSDSKARFNCSSSSPSSNRDRSC